jgi:hypothetical protein
MKRKAGYRELTPEEKEWANRLNAIFLNKKKSESLSGAIPKWSYTAKPARNDYVLYSP